MMGLAPGQITICSGVTGTPRSWAKYSANLARASGKPVVIDFYADWCTACKELDHKTWVDASVQQEAERFVAIKMDFTEKSDWAAEKKAEYGVAGLPTVIFEARSRSLPIIATRAGAIADHIRPSSRHRLVPPHAPDALSRAIDELASRHTELTV